MSESSIHWTSVQDKTPDTFGLYMVQVKSGSDGVVEQLGNWLHLPKTRTPRWIEPTSSDPLKDVLAWRKTTAEEIQPYRIEQAYERYRGFLLYPDYPHRPPPSRLVEVGDKLEVGNLKNPVVVAVKEDGCVVVFSFRSSSGRDSSPGEATLEYRALPWYNVLPAKAVRHDVVLSKPPVFQGSFSNSSLSGLLQQVFQGLEDAPDFQRGYVWNVEDQQRYLDTLMQGRDLGRFILVRRKYPLQTMVLDGKQRLNCLRLFFTSELDWRGVFWHELSYVDRHRAADRLVQTATIEESEYTRADLLRVFLEVNAAGVPQTPEHLAHVQALLEQEEAQNKDQAASA